MPGDICDILFIFMRGYLIVMLYGVFASKYDGHLSVTFVQTMSSPWSISVPGQFNTDLALLSGFRFAE